MRIVETDNFNSDYPDEKFIEIYYYMNENQAQVLCSVLNSLFSSTTSPRWYKVVHDDYKLEPGFEP